MLRCGLPSVHDGSCSGRRASMTDQIQLRVNGRNVTVKAGTVVAAAIARAGVTAFRRSPLGRSCAPLCGMGVCMECRVTIDGKAHSRSCITLCAEGMDVRTDD
jgi:D-hydroxyproline dehydrogenase subunit gamma